jgi:hypothetical protein
MKKKKKYNAKNVSISEHLLPISNFVSYNNRICLKFLGQLELKGNKLMHHCTLDCGNVKSLTQFGSKRDISSEQTLGLMGVLHQLRYR